MKLCCRGDQEYMKGIPATVDSGLIAMAWALKPGNPNSTVHICKRNQKPVGFDSKMEIYLTILWFYILTHVLLQN